MIKRCNIYIFVKTITDTQTVDTCAIGKKKTEYITFGCRTNISFISGIWR